MEAQIKAKIEAQSQFIALLMEQLKRAREEKKSLQEMLKLEKARTKMGKKATKDAVAEVPAERRYADTYQNRKLERVGKLIPSRKKTP